jgi:hypothetical protein
MKLNILLVLFLMTMFSFTRCRKIEIDIDPAEAILGKWEKIEFGDWPTMFQIPEPSSSIEYLPDGTKRTYHYESERYSYARYSIDTLLFEQQSLPGGGQLTLRYTYQFSDNTNKLRLDMFETPFTHQTFILKRIK